MKDAKEKQKHEASRRRHNFLIDAFFRGVDGYSINESVAGWVLVKHLNGDTGDYEVAIYTKDAYQAYKEYNDKNSLFPSQVDKT